MIPSSPTGRLAKKYEKPVRQAANTAAMVPPIDRAIRYTRIRLQTPQRALNNAARETSGPATRIKAARTYPNRTGRISFLYPGGSIGFTKSVSAA